MDALFFLNPTTKAVLDLPQALRRQVFERLVRLLKGSRIESEALTPQIWISRLEPARHGGIHIVFAHRKHELVVMKLALDTQSLSLPQLETDLDVLDHVDHAPFGFRIDVRGQEPDVAARLDHAIDAYRRFHISSALTDSVFLVPGNHDVDASDVLSELLGRADHKPQRLKQGDRSYVVVEASQLQSLVRRKNAAEVYHYFFEEVDGTEPFERVGATPLAPLLDLH